MEQLLYIQYKNNLCNLSFSLQNSQFYELYVAKSICLEYNKLFETRLNSPSRKPSGLDFNVNRTVFYAHGLFYFLTPHLLTTKGRISIKSLQEMKWI